MQGNAFWELKWTVQVEVPTWVWVHRCALKQDSGGTIAQWAVHHVAVSRDPANVRHAAKHVSVLVVKHVLTRHNGMTQTAALYSESAFLLPVEPTSFTLMIIHITVH